MVISRKALIITVLGMHRSGTSFIAQVLAKCGVYLGPEEELFPPHSIDNSDGYWENTRFVEINEDILAHTGNSWRLPPESLSDNWFKDEDYSVVRDRAKDIIHLFEDHDAWGWKDPRTSITYDFWRDLLPDLKCIISVRNPLEVALSLGKGYEDRDLDIVSALHLWVAYYEHILSHVDMHECVVTNYDVYLYDPVSEISRVLEGLAINISLESIETLSKAFKKQLHRNAIDLSTVHSLGLPIDLVDKVTLLYETLNNHAGSVYAKMKHDTEYQRQIQEHSLSDMARGIFSQSKQLIDYFHLIRSLRQDIEDLQLHIGEQKQERESKEELLQEQEHMLNSLNSQIESLSAQLYQNSQQLQIEHSLMMQYAQMIEEKHLHITQQMRMIEDLRFYIERQESVIEESRSKVVILEARAQSAQSELVHRDTEIQSLQRDTNEQQHYIEQCNQELAILQSSMIEIQYSFAVRVIANVLWKIQHVLLPWRHRKKSIDDGHA